ncbi:glycerophosphodiester phosphodiesterase [Paenibacillus glucanolyticus]|jgi:glycerophosphoryl diester phosphodiesterase|uniref:glycerophosphodiester phosphodiesterase n=1 Tax=Paenibacillus TaxID=44249 RepID=UPI0003E2257F|nr:MULTISPECIES: glycerophosphodiester phosphodiesterase family protein [Paenibacillus]ANA81511.1 glycerophosphodiester phosphodiesterase [Paenibacillus glucanolyticus]AVV59758.1 glycerophosphodiester phosphodiesterase [Paenibacillus glucanolyticus]AWP29010.1 glycerophosphodiester phosphodiesterase [Paenibacillus sp. Cedars]ETT33455.1 glycerophosphoryl diester phosphodiesterase [Paenibacillus sp. FSL R5-808]MDH6674035.1 glycerophosphoryl diester phosphodiesterase [Paenibacillus sp. LBL]
MKKMIVIMTAALMVTGFRISADVPNYPLHDIREQAAWIGSEGDANQSWINIAHRGASGAAPENTMASFAKAFDMGADMLELDVQMSKDGEMVVIHDTTVDRTTNGQGNVGDLTFQELRQLDAGSWYGSEYKGELIPTLSEVLEHFGGRIGLLIELKSPDLYPGIEQGVADGLKKVMKGANGPQRYKEMVVVQSADTDALLRFHRLMPDIPLGVVITSSGELSRERMQDMKAYAEYVNVSMRLVTKGLVQKIHQSGMKTFVWTIRDMLQIPYVLQINVDGIITDYPDRVPISITNRKTIR